MKEIKQLSKWKCEYCDKFFKSIESCRRHEVSCKIEHDTKEYYKSFISDFSLDNVFIAEVIYAKSLEDFYKMIRLNLIDNPCNEYDYERFDFPCNIIIIHEEFDTNEPFETEVYAYELNDYITRLKVASNKLSQGENNE